MAITFDSHSAVVSERAEHADDLTEVTVDDTGGSAESTAPTVDLSIVSANRRAENAELQLAVEKAQAARMRFEALRLAEVADDLAGQVAKLQAELQASRAEAARMHGVVVATRIDADHAKQDRSALAAEVDLLTTELAHASADLGQTRIELVDLREAAETTHAQSVTERENLESAIRLAAEFDELRHDRRVERDTARLEADRNKRLLTAANERIEDLEQQAANDRSLEEARLVELARIAQQEVDEAFAAGSRLGDRAALRSVLLERELAAARKRMKTLSSGGCPDPAAHEDLNQARSTHPSQSSFYEDTALSAAATTGRTLQERIAALPDATVTGR